MLKQIAMGVLRHVVTGAGTALVAHGYIMQSDLEPLLGSVLFIAGLAWSAYQKKQARAVS